MERCFLSLLSSLLFAPSPNFQSGLIVWVDVNAASWRHVGREASVFLKSGYGFLWMDFSASAIAWWCDFGVVMVQE